MFKKVVFTGGACGGKSSIIESLKNKVNSITTPEPAWIVFGLQQKLNFKFNSFDRQWLIFNLHVLFEYWAEDKTQNNEVILMDRSILDNSVFTNVDQYNYLFNRYRIGSIKNNYSTVVYCKSIAHNKANEFKMLRQFADIEQTKEIDLKLLKAYESCPNIIYNTKDSLAERIEESFLALKNVKPAKSSMHSLINKDALNLIIKDSKIIMSKYNIKNELQNYILSPILKKQNKYLDSINQL